MLGDAIAAALPTMQAEAESAMVTPYVARRVTGTHEVDGRDVPLWGVVASGRCQLQSAETVTRDPDVAGATVTVQRYQVKVPVSAGPFWIGDRFELLGRTFRVTALHGKTYQTAQRLPVDEVL